MKRKLKAVDLFSGAGGLSCGLRKAGFRVLGAIDNDPLAIETYRLNHPRVKVFHANLEKVKVAYLSRELKLKPGELDLLAGCPPCQAFSTLRSLNGNRRVRDGSKDLIYEFMRFVRGLRPQAVMLENVPRLSKDRRLREVKRELGNLGYSVVCDVLNASDYAVPQRRRRMILIALRRGEARFAPPARQQRYVEDAIRGIGARKRSDALHDTKSNRCERIRELIRKIPRDGGSRRSLGKKGQLRCHREFDGFKDIYGRMAWKDFAPTLTSGCINPSKGRFLHPRCNRAITLREAALLQTFPRSYRFPLNRGKYAVARMIGNALPPEFIRRHALQVLKSLHARPRNSRNIDGRHWKRHGTN